MILIVIVNEGFVLSQKVYMFSVISWWYVLCMEYVFISYYVIELEGFINK